MSVYTCQNSFICTRIFVHFYCMYLNKLIFFKKNKFLVLGKVKQEKLTYILLFYLYSKSKSKLKVGVSGAEELLPLKLNQQNGL